MNLRALRLTMLLVAVPTAALVAPLEHGGAESTPMPGVLVVRNSYSVGGDGCVGGLSVAYGHREVEYEHKSSARLNEDCSVDVSWQVSDKILLGSGGELQVRAEVNHFISDLDTTLYANFMWGCPPQVTWAAVDFYPEEYTVAGPLINHFESYCTTAVVATFTPTQPPLVNSGGQEHTSTVRYGYRPTGQDLCEVDWPQFGGTPPGWSWNCYAENIDSFDRVWSNIRALGSVLPGETREFEVPSLELAP